MNLDEPVSQALLDDIRRFGKALYQEGGAIAATSLPRDIAKVVYKTFDFVDEELWLKMLRDRNAISHTYNADAVLRLIHMILPDYILAFVALREAVLQRSGD